MAVPRTFTAAILAITCVSAVVPSRYLENVMFKRLLFAALAGFALLARSWIGAGRPSRVIGFGTRGRERRYQCKDQRSHGSHERRHPGISPVADSARQTRRISGSPSPYSSAGYHHHRFARSHSNTGNALPSAGSGKMVKC
jgi:hypothetical protein